MGGYHAVNLAVHVLCAWLVFGVARRLFAAPRVGERRGRRRAGLATALLWTVHPLATETVVYVVQRTESLMALCLLATLYAFLRGAASVRPAPWLAASVAACTLGMGCKQVMVVAPLVVLCADALFVTGSFAASLRARAAYYGGLAATWAVLGLLLAGGEVARATGLDLELGVTPLQYLWTQSRAILHYLRLAVWPSPLCCTTTGRPCAHWARPGRRWPSWARSSSRPRSACGAACPPPSRAPCSSWCSRRPRASCRSRPSSWPSGGCTSRWRRSSASRSWAPTRASSVWRAPRVPARARRRRGARGRTGQAAFARVLDYRTEESIWRDTVEKSPGSAVVRNNYGRALANLGRQDEAIAQYREGLRLKPDDARTWAKLGNALAEQGKLAEAVDAFRKALRYEPTDEKTHNNLARVLLRTGDLPGAIAHLQEAVRLDPSYALGRLNLAKLLANAGRFAEARGELERVVAMPGAPADARAGAQAILADLGRR